MQNKGYVKHVEYKFLLDTAHFVFEHEKIKTFPHFPGADYDCGD